MCWMSVRCGNLLWRTVTSGRLQLITAAMRATSQVLHARGSIQHSISSYPPPPPTSPPLLLLILLHDCPFEASSPAALPRLGDLLWCATCSTDPSARKLALSTSALRQVSHGGGGGGGGGGGLQLAERQSADLDPGPLQASVFLQACGSAWRAKRGGRGQMWSTWWCFMSSLVLTEAVL